MTCNSSTCQKPAASIEAPEVEDAAGRLAGLLSETVIFRNFIRLARQIRVDGEVIALVNAINDQEYAANPFNGQAAGTQELEERLEALPLVSEYRAAEAAARELFRAVDGVISGAAGVAFAANARSCGHG